MIHELKILPEYFNAVISGEKTFEIRKNDRPFHKGDLLALNEFDGQYWTGNSCLVYVDYILNNPDYVKKDMVIMGIKLCSVLRHTEPFNLAKIAKDYSVPLVTKCDDERRWAGMSDKKINVVTVRWWDGYKEDFRATEVRFGSDLLWMRLEDGNNRHIPLRMVRWFGTSIESHQNTGM